MNLRVAQLCTREHTVALQNFLLIVECFDDHTDKKLHEEHANDNNQDHTVDDEWGIVVLNWLVVGSYSVDHGPHDVDPALSRLDSHQSEQTMESCVEVEIRSRPFATIIDAVPHRLNILYLLLHAKVKVISVAAVEGTREEGCLKDCEEEDEE